MNTGEEKNIKNIKSETCILLCAGDLNLSQIEAAQQDYVIAVDGGILYADFLGLEPQLIVGDFDSIDEKGVQLLAGIEGEHPEKVVRLKTQKDDTDTLAALKEGLKRGYRKFRLYAAMGGRLEHTIANLQTLLYLKEQGAQGYLMDAECMVFLIQEEEISFQQEMEGYLSLFAMNGKAEGVTIRGMKYLLQDAVLTESFPVGISNEFTKEQAVVSVHKGTLLAIVRWV